MKVISAQMAIYFLESTRSTAEHLVAMLELSLKAGQACEVDLKLAKRNLESIDMKIAMAKEISFDSSELYSTKVTA